MCLLDNREVRNGWEPLKQAVTGVFTKHGGNILSARRWDERRIAYPIKGQNRGTYLLVYFAAETQSVTAIRRDLQFNESVLRSLLLDCEEVPQSAYEPEAAFDVNAIPPDDSDAVTEVETPAEEASGEEASAEDASGDAEPAADAKTEDK
ncbi:MAG: 30S ribosomal protein S6 [Planctomycetes bacterium]|nr:30S ribosomal protein S6 [Planctomycetota bacterium]